MKIALNNRQKLKKIQTPALRKLVRLLLKEAAFLKPERLWDSVGVVLMDDATISEVNAAYFGKDRPTDVITFTYEPQPGFSSSYTGEMIVNVERALTVGPKHGGVGQELALYLAHSCLHLYDEEDGTAAERARMRRLEKKILAGVKAEISFEDLLEKDP